MTPQELIQRLSLGEDSRHQFKADVTNADALAAELVAFSNSGGGQMLIGVGDHGQVVGLSPEAIHRINQLLSNASSQNVRPAVNPLTENLAHPAGTVMVLTIPNGCSRPYMDRHGTIWVKSGADKRKATSGEEIRRMIQEADVFHADATLVNGSSIADIDLEYFSRFFEKLHGEKIEDQLVPLSKILEHKNLAQGTVLNYAGVLLFSKRAPYLLPAFIVKAVAFYGADIAENRYIDSKDISGQMADVFQQCMSFLLSNLRAPQGDKGFNSVGDPEIPREALEELMVNALVHRNYFLSAPIRLFIFSDRVEIISPGHLPNHLTLENVKGGNSNFRNPILASYALRLLPYRGVGSGILRALQAYPDIEFVDDREGNLFKVIVKRPALPGVGAND
jgi:ATP-dependent DNA helicase RecG